MIVLLEEIKESIVDHGFGCWCGLWSYRIYQLEFVDELAFLFMAGTNGLCDFLFFVCRRNCGLCVRSSITEVFLFEERFHAVLFLSRSVWPFCRSCGSLGSKVVSFWVQRNLLFRDGFEVEGFVGLGAVALCWAWGSRLLGFG